MPRKPDALLDYKLRIREDLRRRIEKAAERNHVSLNGEMVNRLRSSFEQEALLTIYGVSEDLGNAWARHAEMFHALNKQGDLIHAAEALVALIKAGKPTETAVAKVEQAIRAIETEAAKMPRSFHTT